MLEGWLFDWRHGWELDGSVQIATFSSSLFFSDLPSCCMAFKDHGLTLGRSDECWWS